MWSRPSEAECGVSGMDYDFFSNVVYLLRQCSWPHVEGWTRIQLDQGVFFCLVVKCNYESKFPASNWIEHRY